MRPYRPLATAAAALVLGGAGLVAAPAGAATASPRCATSGTTVAEQRVGGRVVARLSRRAGVLRGCTIVGGGRGVTRSLGRLRTGIARVDGSMAAFTVPRTAGDRRTDRVWAVELATGRAWLQDRAAVPHRAKGDARRNDRVRALAVDGDGAVMWAGDGGAVVAGGRVQEAIRLLNADGTPGPARYEDDGVAVVDEVGALTPAAATVLGRTLTLTGVGQDGDECGASIAMTFAWGTGDAARRAGTSVWFETPDCV